MPKKPKPTVVVENTFADVTTPTDRWYVIGLDPSISRTGFATMSVIKGKAKWSKIGSISPKDTSQEDWLRGKGIATAVKKIVEESIAETIKNDGQVERRGLLFSIEYATPRNDFLITINRILKVVLTDREWLASLNVHDIHIMHTNAATLRSLMGLVSKGDNKGENTNRAYDFISKDKYPGLDSDACDAVLLGMMGRYAAAALLGEPEILAEKVKAKLLDDGYETKKRNGRVAQVPCGIMLDSMYWWTYKPLEVPLIIRDAKIPMRKRLTTVSVTV